MISYNGVGADPSGVHTEERFLEMTGRAWTANEEAQLLEELSAGVKLDAISVSHRRTQGAIRSRQRHMAANFYVNGMTINEIMDKCHLTKQPLLKSLRNRGLIGTSDIMNLTSVNEALKYAGGIPQNKWDYGKYREMCENNLKEAQKRLETHKKKISEMESNCRLRGVQETEIQKGVHQSFSVMHIQLLEQVLAAKKTLSMMDMGTVEELTRQKIAILEEMALEPMTP